MSYISEMLNAGNFESLRHRIQQMPAPALFIAVLHTLQQITVGGGGIDAENPLSD